MRSKAVGVGIFAGSDVVRREAAQVVAKLGIKEFGPAMAALVKDAKQPVSLRVEALFAVDALQDPATKELAAFALASRRTEAPRRGPRGAGAARTGRGAEGTAGASEGREGVASSRSRARSRSSPAQRSSEEADKLLDEWLDAVLAGKVPSSSCSTSSTRPRRGRTRRS